MQNDVVPHKFIQQPKPLNVEVSPMEVDLQDPEKLNLNTSDKTTTQNLSNEIDSIDLGYSDIVNFPTLQDSDNNGSSVCCDYPISQSQKVNAAVQVKIQSSYRSISVQCKSQTKDRALSPIEILIENERVYNNSSFLSPTSNDQLTNTSNNTTLSSFPTSSGIFLSTNATNTENYWKNLYQQEEFQKLNLEQTVKKIRQFPCKYIGVPNDYGYHRYFTNC